MADASETAVHVVISGRVQGVWFRGWTQRQAEAHNIRGWIRNRRDGTVEAVFAGRPDDIEAILEACRQGPPAANVTAVRTRQTAPPEGAGFHPRPTA